MAIASISGSSSSTPVRTSMEPVRGVRMAEGSDKKYAERKDAELEHKKEIEAKNASNRKEFENAKGVKEVDVKV